MIIRTKRHWQNTMIHATQKLIPSLIILGGVLSVVVGICGIMAYPDSAPEPLPLGAEIEIEGPLGTYRVRGVSGVIAPLVREIGASNRIEAAENHRRWPEMSRDPRDY